MSIKYFFLLLVLFCSCNLSKDRKLSEKEIVALEKAHNDSVVVIIDSLKKTSIYVPPLYDKEIFDSATTVKFYDLARSTKGELKLLVNSQLIVNEIVDIVKSYSADNSDLLLLIDKTGSMTDDIENVKKGLNQIIETIRQYHHIRLGIALYGDKNADGPDWFSFKDFETDYDASKAFINGIETTQGGDYPESVYDGFFKACEQNFWRSETKRMVILIGDAPPLEKPLSNYSVNDIIQRANADKIKMNFYPIVVTPTAGDIFFEGSAPTATKKETATYEKDSIIASVFPNPTTGPINITFNKPGSYSLEIFNSDGSLMLSDNITGNGWKRDLGSFKNGAYMVRIIRKDKKFETVKFIVYK